MRTWVLILAALGCCWISESQTNSVKLLHSYRTDLPKSQIYAIAQDSFGFIWIGTRDGLIRSDGLQIWQFDANIGLGFNYCADFHIDDDHNLWIASKADYQGVSRLNLNSLDFTHFPYLSSDSGAVDGKGIAAIAQAKDGRMLFLSTSLQLYLFDESHFEVQNIQEQIDRSFQFTQVTDLLIDPHQSDRCWVSTLNGIFSYDFTRRRIDTSWLSTNSIVHQLHHHDADPTKIWASAGLDGIIQIDLTTSSKEIFTPDVRDLNATASRETLAEILEISTKDENELWLATGSHGIGTFHLPEQEFHFRSFDGSREGFIRSIYSDASGNLWYGSDLDGLYYLDNATSLLEYQFLDIELHDHLPSKLNTAEQVAPGLFLLGFSGYQYVWIWHRNKGLVSKIALPPSVERVTDFISLDDHRYLAATNWGLYHLNLSTQKFTPAIDVYPDPKQRNFYNIQRDPNGQGFWVINWNVGLIHLDKELKLYSSYHNAEVMHPWVHDFCFDRQGQIWAGSERGLALLAPGDEQFTPFTTLRKQSQLFPNLNVNSVVTDRWGRLWTSHFGSGLCVINHQKPEAIISSIGKADGLPADRLYDLETDRENRIWFWSSEGLGMVLPSLDPDSIEIKYFPETRDIPTDKAGTSFRLDPQGHITLGMLGGFVKFDPEILADDASIPSDPITNYLTTAEEDKKWTGHKIQLDPGQNYFSINYSSVNFKQPHNLEFSYRLVGYDENWVFSGQRREAIYTKVPPGNYEFEVRARHAFGAFGTPSIPVLIELLPAWYQTKIAKVGWAVLLIFGLLSILHFVRNREKLKANLLVQKMEAENLKIIDQTKSNFFTQISHEFKTPLTVILGMADQLSKNPDVSFIAKAAAAIKRNGRDLFQHINQILDLTKLKTHHITLELRRGDITKYIAYLVEGQRMYASQREIDIQLKQVDSIEMDYDRDRFKDVFINLLSNAIKFSPDDSTIRVDVTEILHLGEPYLLLEVADEGGGIPPDDLSLVFEPYYRSPKHLQKSGSGLGLAITKQWIEAMAGNIEVQSRLGQGSVFKVMLPISRIAEQHQPEVGPLDTKSAPVAASHFVPPKEMTDRPIALLVDDHQDVLDYLSICVEMHYQVLQAKDGASAVGIAIEQVPDIIISDVMMPVMDGHQMLQQLRKNVVTNHIPVILLSARSSQEERNLSLSHGADAYLSKPFNEHELLSVMKNQLVRLNTLKEKFSRFSNEVKVDTLDPSDEFLDRLEAFVRAQLVMDFSVEEVAKEFQLSRVQLYRKVKALTGHSVSSYIRLIRLFEGKHLLRTTSKTIAEIAYEVGFKDPNYFSRTFREQFQVTPGKFREVTAQK